MKIQTNIIIVLLLCGLEVDDWGNDYANKELFKNKIKITISSDELYRLRY